MIVKNYRQAMMMRVTIIITILVIMIDNTYHMLDSALSTLHA